MRWFERSSGWIGRHPTFTLRTVCFGLFLVCIKSGTRAVVSASDYSFALICYAAAILLGVIGSAEIEIERLEERG